MKIPAANRIVRYSTLVVVTLMIVLGVRPRSVGIVINVRINEGYTYEESFAIAGNEPYDYSRCIGGF